MKTLVLYQSFTGNTKRVTERIVETLELEGLMPKVVKVTEKTRVELYDYDLVLLGTPVIELLPARPILRFMQLQLKIHGERGDIIPCSPKLAGKYAVCYCTYSGPHTGKREAVPAMKYMEQFFEHLRFTVLAEWYIIGELKRNETLSTQGFLGDIRGRPDEKDLSRIEKMLKSVTHPLLADTQV